MSEFILYYTHCDEKIKFLKLKAFFYYWDYLYPQILVPRLKVLGIKKIYNLKWKLPFLSKKAWKSLKVLKNVRIDLAPQTIGKT
jgi:hypothetical protein